MHQLHLLSLSVLFILQDDILQNFINGWLLILFSKVCKEVYSYILDPPVVFISLSQCLLIYDLLSGPWLLDIIEEELVEADLLRVGEDFFKFSIQAALCLRVSNHCDFFISKDERFTIDDTSDRKESRLLIEEKSVIYDITLAEVFNFEFTLPESCVDLRDTLN